MKSLGFMTGHSIFFIMKNGKKAQGIDVQRWQGMNIFKKGNTAI